MKILLYSKLYLNILMMLHEQFFQYFSHMQQVVNNTCELKLNQHLRLNLMESIVMPTLISNCAEVFAIAPPIMLTFII